MREILFRGKRKDNGEWVEGYLYIKYFQELPHDRFVIQYKPKYDSKMWQPTYMIAEVIPETVGQYTGLTDKNGTKIFEGDIVKTDNGKHSAISVIKYGEFEPLLFYDLLEKFFMNRPKEKMVGLFAKSIKKGEEMFLSNGIHLIEIIGNIHDNPELLGGAE